MRPAYVVETLSYQRQPDKVNTKERETIDDVMTKIRKAGAQDG